MNRPCALSLFGLVWAGTIACNHAPEDLREWKPTDHRHTAEATPASDPNAPQVTGSAEPPLPGLDEVTIATWRRGCTTCHGELGRGDGPQGPMNKARDLSDAAWQASVTDAQIADVISKGRGKMPAFPLPASTIEGLTHLVRLFDRDRVANEARRASAAQPKAVTP